MVTFSEELLNFCPEIFPFSSKNISNVPLSVLTIKVFLPSASDVDVVSKPFSSASPLIVSISLPSNSNPDFSEMFVAVLLVFSAFVLPETASFAWTAFDLSMSALRSAFKPL